MNLSYKIGILLVICCLTCKVQGQKSSWAWAINGLNTGDAECYDVTTDASGTVFITGSFFNTLAFDTISLVSNGNKDFFVAKFDANGHVAWAKSFGSFDVDEGSGIVTDASGNLYVSGSFSDTIILGNDTLISKGDQDIFVAKYNYNGALLWIKTAGGVLPDRGGFGIGGITMDNSNHVYITGEFASASSSPVVYGTAVFDTITLTSNGSGDIFLAKYDTSGNLIWAKNAGGYESDFAFGIDNDSLGNVYISGTYGIDYAYFDSIKLISNSTGFVVGNMFVAKYDSNGNALWAKGAGGNGIWSSAGSAITGVACAVTKSGDVYVTGYYFNCNMNFGNGFILNKIGDNDIFIAKYSSVGDLIWIRNAGWKSYDNSMGIATDGDDNVYITGSYNEMGIFGTDTLFQLGAPVPDIYVAKYDKDGNALWAVNAGGTGYDQGNALTCDHNGNIYVTGHFSSAAADFGAYSLYNNGSKSMFLAKLSQTTGLPDNPSADDGVYIYPNPSQGSFTARRLNQAFTEIFITDLSGKILYAKPTGRQKEVTIQFHAPPGLYFLQLKGKEKNITRKIIIQP